MAEWHDLIRRRAVDYKPSGGGQIATDSEIDAITQDVAYVDGDGNRKVNVNAVVLAYVRIGLQRTPDLMPERMYQLRRVESRMIQAMMNAVDGDIFDAPPPGGQITTDGGYLVNVAESGRNIVFTRSDGTQVTIMLSAPDDGLNESQVDARILASVLLIKNALEGLPEGQRLDFDLLRNQDDVVVGLTATGFTITYTQADGSTHDIDIDVPNNNEIRALARGEVATWARSGMVEPSARTDSQINALIQAGVASWALAGNAAPTDPAANTIHGQESALPGTVVVGEWQLLGHSVYIGKEIDNGSFTLTPEVDPDPGSDDDGYSRARGFGVLEGAPFIEGVYWDESHRQMRVELESGLDGGATFTMVEGTLGTYRLARQSVGVYVVAAAVDPFTAGTGRRVWTWSVATGFDYWVEETDFEALEVSNRTGDTLDLNGTTIPSADATRAGVQTSENYNKAESALQSADIVDKQDAGQVNALITARGYLTRSQVDARVVAGRRTDAQIGTVADTRMEAAARAGSSDRWGKTKIPSDVVYDADIVDFQTASEITSEIGAAVNAIPAPEDEFNSEQQRKLKFLADDMADAEWVALDGVGIGPIDGQDTEPTLAQARAATYRANNVRARSDATRAENKWYLIRSEDELNLDGINDRVAVRQDGEDDVPLTGELLGRDVGDNYYYYKVFIVDLAAGQPTLEGQRREKSRLPDVIPDLSDFGGDVTVDGNNDFHLVANSVDVAELNIPEADVVEGRAVVIGPNNTLGSQALATARVLLDAQLPDIVVSNVNVDSAVSAFALAETFDLDIESDGLVRAVADFEIENPSLATILFPNGTTEARVSGSVLLRDVLESTIYLQTSNDLGVNILEAPESAEVEIGGGGVQMPFIRLARDGQNRMAGNEQLKMEPSGAISSATYTLRTHLRLELFEGASQLRAPGSGGLWHVVSTDQFDGLAAPTASEPDGTLYIVTSGSKQGNVYVKSTTVTHAMSDLGLEGFRLDPVADLPEVSGSTDRYRVRARSRVSFTDRNGNTIAANNNPDRLPPAIDYIIHDERAVNEANGRIIIKKNGAASAYLGDLDVGVGNRVVDVIRQSDGLTWMVTGLAPVVNAALDANEWITTLPGLAATRTEYSRDLIGELILGDILASVSRTTDSLTINSTNTYTKLAEITHTPTAGVDLIIRAAGGYLGAQSSAGSRGGDFDVQIRRGGLATSPSINHMNVRATDEPIRITAADANRPAIETTYSLWVQTTTGNSWFGKTAAFNITMEVQEAEGI